MSVMVPIAKYEADSTETKTESESWDWTGRDPHEHTGDDLLWLP